MRSINWISKTKQIMRGVKIKELLNGEKIGEQVIVKGWVRTFRSNRFIALNDGSTSKNLQAVVDFEKFGFKHEEQQR